MERFFKTLIFVIYINYILSIPLTPDKLNSNYPYYNRSEGIQSANDNKTIEQLVQKQTETVKRIVTDQSQLNRFQYPSVTKFGIDTNNYNNNRNNNNNNKKETPIDVERLTLEELKTKCQHLSKLFNDNRSEDEEIPSKIKIFTKSPINGFYITSGVTTATSTATRSPLSLLSTTPTTTTTTTTTTIKPKQNIKYIKLEPVILQKTILSDGRTIYYWHKSLPSAVQFAPLPPTNVVNTAVPTTTTTTSTTTTTPATHSYDFRNFFPSFYSFRGSESSSETAIEKTTTTTPSPPLLPLSSSLSSSSSSSTPLTNDELLYTQQLRFVVPVPYASPDTTEIKHPWDFDQYAYYPKPLQPETVNVKVPYVPTFHIIKALAIPDNISTNHGDI